MSKKLSPYDIQVRAIASLKEEFEQAAHDARGKIHAAVEMAMSATDVEQVRSVAGFKYPSFSYNLGYARDRMQFLLQGAEGRYQPADSHLSVNVSMKLWGDYLQSIGRHSTGFASVPANEGTIDSLIKQNGPKKMEQRLKSYLKRRIKDAVKSADYGIAPQKLKI